jgi:hypothetical protein
VWYTQEYRCQEWRKSIYQLLSMIKDKSYKDDKVLTKSIDEMNYPNGLHDIYQFLEKIYDGESDK